MGMAKPHARRGRMQTPTPSVLVVLTASLLAYIGLASDGDMPDVGISRDAVLITGGRGGIGRAVADGLAAAGYTAIITVRKQADVDAIKAEISTLEAVLFDVTKAEHTDAAVANVRALLSAKNLRLTGVVANAGINPEGDRFLEAVGKGEARPQEMVDEEMGMSVLATNVVGVGRTCRAFLPLLRESGNGRLVLLGSYFGSIAGALGAGHLYYEASKHAVEGIADNLRRSEAKRGSGVRVSLVKPGNIITAMNPKPFGEDEPAVVVRSVRHALGPSPKRRYFAGRVKGWPCGLLCWVFTHMPTAITDRLA